MPIGDLARKAAVNIQTIRFYEREGLLPVPSRNRSGYRRYESGDLERVTFIKRNQELGFTLEENQATPGPASHGRRHDIPSASQTRRIASKLFFDSCFYFGFPREGDGSARSGSALRLSPLI
jgi:DNA-binding transcriptional MerR regulator